MSGQTEALTFHEAWGAAKDRHDYNKEDWKRAQRHHESERHTIERWLEIAKAAPGDRQPWEQKQ